MDAPGLVSPPHVAGPLRLAPFRAITLAADRVGNPTAGRAFSRPYRDVDARLRRWEARGLATRDADPALYVHEYSTGALTVRGLVGALDVSRRAHRPEDRCVLPHEGIHPTQADELADRMELMQVNPAPILLVHHATPEHRDLIHGVTSRPVQAEVTDRAGQQHRIWAVRDDQTIARITASLEPTRALIADGHHRYAAYLRLQRRHAVTGTTMPTDFGLAMLVDHLATPLFLGPIHRTLAGTDLEDLRDAVETTGHTFRLAERAEAIAALDPRTITMTDGRRWAIVTLLPHDDGPVVDVLHREIVPELRHGPRVIGYHHSAEEALAEAEHDRPALLLPAPSVDAVLQVARAGRLLPEKATSFQPKPSLGVLIRSMHDGPPDPR